ncbi:hypothetical protein RN001_006799 [Aquatica leii]|uniref:Angiotensin-converting enzyme n=1 Tax=Aquatica leii TaxID=1421715 RepID=A0AAN7P8N6_9COLE|nr:hypothetical protein RN001_006799 [Aquatica leii]
MELNYTIFLLIICLSWSVYVCQLLSEAEVKDFLEKTYEKKASLVTNKFVRADYNFATDVNNKAREEAKVQETLNAAKFNKEQWKEVFKNVNTSSFTNEFVIRQVDLLKVVGNAALDEDKLTILTNSGNVMTNIYSTGKICPYQNQSCDLPTEGLTLEPDIEKILASSKDYDELVYVWKAWRDVTGKKIKKHYTTYVSLSNEAAVLNDFKDKGDMWKNDYQTENFEADMDRLWEQVKPLYEELHKYVGYKLKKQYGDKLNIDDGLIPAHVFGNMWAQSWINLEDLVRPYPNANSIDVTSALQEQGYRPLKMFQTADDFYTSLGLESNKMSYNEELGAVITKPNDKEILIKMCTDVTYEDFITVHHEMGHIEYFILYKDQPIAFRNGANPGFHEAVGDTIALSATTPKHLEEIGLLQNYTESYEADINSLMNAALERVAFLPFGLLIDKWRWDVFAGKVTESEWNDHWWKYRETIQKVKAPIPRSSDDFDPGAKFHVPGDAQYINYFVAHILEFQLYRSFCKLAGEYDPTDPEKPLHKCSFYKNKDVGAKLRAGLSLGASKHWKDALKVMTDETDLDASAIMDYFKPLYDYLKLQNQIQTEEEWLITFLNEKYENEASSISNKFVIADWDFATDINNNAKENALLNATLEMGNFNKHYWETIFQTLNPSNYTNESLKRQIKLLKVLGQAALDESKLEQLTMSINKMKNIYSTAKICPYKNPSCNLTIEGLSLEPDIEMILSESFDYDELKYTWIEWHNATGKKMKSLYQTYVDLNNEAAVINGFNDTSEMWKSFYESDTFEADIEKLWNQVKPLYDQLHSYVAIKLKEHYGDEIDVEDGLIPAHVLGNMWGQSWINLVSIVNPYPSASSVNVTAALIEQNYTALKMFQVSDEFYQSLGLEPNSMSYGDLAVIVKPEDREILCHASAWDFQDKKDYRIKMCTEVNYEDFITVHHEMGHIEYFILYKDQPIAFRNGANPGFHEAVGDTIALSVATPKHLEKIGLLGSYEESREAAINTLMDMALERIAFLPFGYLIDKWRWDVFSGKVSYSEWNDRWWYYRKTIQKLKPPVLRTDEDFDPGAKYHVPGDSQYINYFVAHILEFQLYRSLCKTAGQYDPNNSSLPLHKCDFYKSKEVGTKLRKGLSLGLSKHWKEALKEMTGEDDLDATAILEYFEPLSQYFYKYNETLLKSYLENDYEVEASKRLNDLTVAQWNFAIDIANPEKEEIQLQTTLNVAESNKDIWTILFKDLNEDDYDDNVLKRQIKFLRVLGDAALDEEKLSELSSAGSYMTNIFSTAKICPYSKQDCDIKTEGLNLEPDIESILAQSRDYDELVYVWSAWRNATGAKMKDTYKTYVNLSNEAAIINGFNDKGDLWRDAYESPTFISDMDRLWEQVKPLYNELHRYVGKKLKDMYLDKIDISDGLIPAHVFGNMWAQSWINLADFVTPYPNATAINITNGLIEKGYTVKKMFETANEFYMSLGLESCSMSYGDKAVIERPDREILCHASAWDFSDKTDYRIKMCTEINHEDFVTIHHEMGHIEYDILYKDQLVSFRDGANPGFHEAVGDTIALSVSTPKHLKEIGLLTNYEDTPESDINTLMDMALERIAFLPFGLLIDKWRWDVFAGTVKPEEWNSHWWHYRKTIQKLKPPVPRDDNVDFDPGAKYHIGGDSQYINYFFAHILEFQLYKALCIKAGEYDESKPNELHKCDFYKSKEAGDVLRAGLKLGKSEHWKDVLEKMTGSRELQADALLEYFQPLFDFLKEENGPLTDETELSNFLKIDYEPSASKATYDSILAEWNYLTDVSNIDKENEQIAASIRLANFNKVYVNSYFKNLNESDYANEQIQRQLSKLKILGNGALDTEKYKEYMTTSAEMTNVFNLEAIMASSTNYEELKYVWSSWRSASGKPIKDKYIKYVKLSNEAALADGFKDKGEVWRSFYESPTFIDDIDNLWNQVKPLYSELHTFVMKKLKERYKDQLDVSDNLIPAHLLGNMWAQTWTNLFSIVKPYPTASAANITEGLLSQNCSILNMFEMSDNFYQSLGLESNAMSYNVSLGAVIEKPPDRDILCHASAIDFSNGKDFRIKMCTEINHEDFITIHHEMGHIQYFILYKDQPKAFRDSANPGFHEAIGDAIALSVATPKHLTAIGLLNNYEDTAEASINALMEMALERVSFLPFGLLVDKWRWEVFAGNVSEKEYNSLWWKYRKEYQGIKPPVDRSEDDFDPGAKFHVPGDAQYINYFVAQILQFQIYKALCKEAGEYFDDKSIPLHKCDFYKSLKAGEKLRKGLSLGSSKHWSEALREMTGETELNADALLEYFEPLREYLKAQTSDDDKSQIVPIVVGSVIGVLLVAALSFYGYKRYKRR